MTTDKGLKKAIKSQPAYRLPSNFTYRMMQQVREEAYARERALSRMWQALCQSFPSHDTFLFFLPISVSIVCLGVLYWWLERKTRINEEGVSK